jgi:hypothetical protein
MSAIPPSSLPQNHVLPTSEQTIPSSSVDSDEPTLCLMIDNYDSFTFNLYQYFCQLGAEMMVKRNDEITIEEVEVSFSHPPPAAEIGSTCSTLS